MGVELRRVVTIGMKLTLLAKNEFFHGLSGELQDICGFPGKCRMMKKCR